MEDLKGIHGFPHVISQGHLKNQPYIILEKLGHSLKDLLKLNKKHFTIPCIINLGIKLIELLEKLHIKGYIHCDIKPDNIMIGDGERDIELKKEIYLIDFGISSKYYDESGQHINF